MDHTKGFTAKIEYLNRQNSIGGAQTHKHTRSSGWILRRSTFACICVYVYTWDVDCSTERPFSGSSNLFRRFPIHLHETVSAKNWRRFWRCVKRYDQISRGSAYLYAPSEIRTSTWLVEPGSGAYFLGPMPKEIRRERRREISIPSRRW